MQGSVSQYIKNLTRAEMAQTMAYSENNILSRQLRTVKTIPDCQDSSSL